jgi:hypothetical protein
MSRVLALLALAALLAPAPVASALRVPSDAGLVELMAWRQPALLGRDDVVATLWVHASGGPSWRGVYWITSGAQTDGPHQLTVQGEGEFVPFRAGSLALGVEKMSPVFHFLGPNGTTWERPVGEIPVLRHAPTRGHAVLSGAAASDHGRADVPEALMIAPWNALDHAVVLGLDFLAADGSLVERVNVGGCADPASALTEPGCRVVFLLPREGARVALWHEEGGARVVDATHRIARLAREPVMFHGASAS